METLSKAYIRDVKLQLEKKLKEVEASFNFDIRFEVGTISFTDTEARIKLTMESTTVPIATIEDVWAKDCYKYGLTKEDYRSTIELGNKTVSFLKFDTKKRAYPIIVVDSRGSQYKVDINTYRTAARIPAGMPEYFVREQKMATVFNKTFEAPNIDNYMRWASAIYNAMSPENLSCDGELSRIQALAKLRELKIALAYLERIAGHAISEADAYKWYDNNKAGV